MDPFIGQILLVGFNYAPQGWALCNGQLLSISQNTALFALLGTTYGGDGRTTFALPDLRSRVPLGMGQGTGLSNYAQGQLVGQEAVTLTTAQIPAHSHAVNADATNGTVTAPNGNNLAQSVVPGRPPTPVSGFTSGTPASPAQLAPGTIGPQGGGQPHSNIQPSIAMNYIIALQGIFPPRS